MSANQQDGETKAANHTPTPWRLDPNKCRSSPVFVERATVGGDRHIATVYGPDPGSVAEGEEIAKANARFIVTAVNAHARLVAALREIVDAGSSGDPVRRAGLYLSATALLARLEREPDTRGKANPISTTPNNDLP